jgi:hypothetical protein
LHDAADDEVEKSDKEQVDQLQCRVTFSLKNKAWCLGKDTILERTFSLKNKVWCLGKDTT